jgi:hypothetical protein
MAIFPTKIMSALFLQMHDKCSANLRLLQILFNFVSCLVNRSHRKEKVVELKVLFQNPFYSMSYNNDAYINAFDEIFRPIPE